MGRAACSDRLHIFAVCIKSHFGLWDLFLMVLGDLTLRPMYFSIHIRSTVHVTRQQLRMSCLLNMDETPIYLSYHLPISHTSLLLTAVFLTSIPKLSTTSSPSVETISNFLAGSSRYVSNGFFISRLEFSHEVMESGSGHCILNPQLCTDPHSTLNQGVSPAFENIWLN